MTRPQSWLTRTAWRLAISSLVLSGWSFAAHADDRFHKTPTVRAAGYAPTDTRPTQGNPPTLSESTAILESAVRDMYKSIEPTSNTETSPNELLAYADLRALRLYVGALEVSGWSLEQASNDYQRWVQNGAYRTARQTTNDPGAAAAQEKFRAYRETARTLLFRVRETAVSVEHQVSFCDPQVAREWQQTVLPALRDTIAATDPLFRDDLAYQSYSIPGQNPNPAPNTGRVNPVSGGIPRDAVDVTKTPTFAPFDRQGRGQGRYFEVRSYGGPVTVKTIRFRNHESAFGTVGTTTDREITVDQIATPGQPLFIPCNRKRWCDVSDLEVDWENGDNGKRSYGTIELVENSPDDQN